MTEWISPVYDRTQADVDYAMAQLKIGKSDKEYKGCFTVTDINRIENNCRYISDRLNVLAYSNTIETRTWDISDIPNVTDIARLINNVAILIEAFPLSEDAPALPETLLHYEQVNALEKNIYLLKHQVDIKENEFRHCGTFNCGEG